MTATLPRALSLPGVTITAPRIATTVAVASAAAASLAPSLLPRPALVQALLTGLLVAAGWGLAALRHRRPGRRSATTESGSTTRTVAAGAGAVTVGWAVLIADHWQNGVRSAMGVAAVGPTHWALVLVLGGVVAAVLIGGARGLGALARRPHGRRVGAAVLVTAVTATVWAAPAALSRTADASGPAGPATSSMSGAADSLVPWESLGAHGRRFVSAPAAPGTVRTYVGLDSAPSLDARVDLAVRELDRAGGLARSHVVVAVPTGSGWIDSNAVAGFERRFGGDVAEIAVQYSAAPSWVTFVTDRAGATESARALYAALAQRISRMSPDERPALHLYGQSLGALGAAAVGAECGVLLAGPPGGAPIRPGTTVLANASDPVVHWSPRLLVAPPRLDGVRPDAPTPAWLPVVSFLQTTVDLVTSLGAAPGHGHRYGTDQGTALPDCRPAR
ncbi:alpha/beta-hydrolase family protein [Rhodococcus sp. NPDC003348]